jgi:hypothetical protein
MDAKGHPKRPLERSSLPLDSLVEDFLVHSKEESPSLAKYLEVLDPRGKVELGGVLGRFDFRHRGILDAEQRLMARRVLGLLHRPTSDMLVLTNRVLDYLDMNNNALLEAEEVNLCIEILEMFARADSDNATVSEFELQFLYAVLRHIDRNDNQVLDPHERQQLHDGLQSPKAFLQQHRTQNPRVVELLQQRRGENS